MGDDRTELLVRLLTRHQDQLFRYILALLPHVEDARDVLQETSVALYRKFAEYDTGKPFLPWAYSFAYLEVLKFRDSGRRRGRASGRRCSNNWPASVPTTNPSSTPGSRRSSIAWPS